MVYDSVYEANKYLRGTARKQHFWEYFSGSKLQEAPAVATSDDLTTNNGWVFPTNSSYDSTNDQIDLTIASNSFDVSYIDLQKAVYFGSGNNLNDDNFVIRAKITKNNNLGYTSKGSSLLLQVSSALTDSSKSPNPQDCIGMRIDTNRLYGQTKFFVHSTDNGTFWSGESSPVSYDWSTGDLYWEIVGNGNTVTGELFTNADYSTGSLGKASTTQSAHTGMRYLKFCGFVDPSRTATQFSLQEFTIWNGVSNTDDVGIRWTTNNVTGTGSVSMSDSVDGGLTITAGLGGADMTAIDFNDKRQFSPTASTCIVIGKTTASKQGGWGMINTVSSGIHGIKTVINSVNTDPVRLYTSDGTESAQTATSFLCSTAQASFNTYQMLLASSNAYLSINGVLQATKSNNMPTLSMQPFAYVRLSGGITHINYMEAYNT